MGVMRYHLSPEQVVRFWARLDRESAAGCWLWTGSVGPRGYGQVYLAKRIYARAHRLAYALANGEVPDGLVICHSCDRPLCCNPDHLVAATQMENVADMVRKGRHVGGPNAPGLPPRSKQGRVRGERAPKAKLSAEQVKAIRTRYAAGGVTQVQLAAEYGINRNALQMILYRQSWAHV
jgi:hypothetical protein